MLIRSFQDEFQMSILITMQHFVRLQCLEVAFLKQWGLLRSWSKIWRTDRISQMLLLISCLHMKLEIFIDSNLTHNSGLISLIIRSPQTSPWQYPDFPDRKKWQIYQEIREIVEKCPDIVAKSLKTKTRQVYNGPRLVKSIAAIL